MTQETKVPVLICGGGPVGLSLAIELGLRGVECMLVEQGEWYRYGARWHIEP
jgi:2-polyprenyl-6-methoxyphenol hydroxylase-like FAD-dependent oxidoreductase